MGVRHPVPVYMGSMSAISYWGKNQQPFYVQRGSKGGPIRASSELTLTPLWYQDSHIDPHFSHQTDIVRLA